MNEAHLHMVVNHFPIIGIIFGFGILIFGMLLKNKILKNTAYSLFIVSAIFAAISMATGEGAEELIEDMKNVGHKIIHEHEEIAEKFAINLYILGFISIAGIYMNYKNHSKSALVSFVAITISAIAILLAQQTGTTGGEIRHTEIRANSNTSNEIISKDIENDDD